MPASSTDPPKVVLALTAALVFAVPAAYGDGGVTYHNIAHDGVGLDYARTRSPEFEVVLDRQAQSLVTPVTPADLPFLSQITAGCPGLAVWDYDGDLDILSHGGLDVSHAVVADNPGTLLQNQGCSADFVLDSDAIPKDPTRVDEVGGQVPGCTEHIRRNVRAVAVGDLDGDGACIHRTSRPALTTSAAGCGPRC